MKNQALPTEPVSAAVERIASSATFSRAPRAADLLRGVTRMTIAGRESEIKEYTLAAELFGKADYDPKVDSVVRVEASRLRSLLAKYYESEGSTDPVRIEIPKGSYALRITLVPVSTPPEVAAAQPANRRWIAAVVLVAAVVAATGFWRWREGRPPRVAPRPSIAVMPFLDLSPGKDHGHFADGLTQEITAALSQWNGVEVASFTSVQQYKGRPVDVRKAGGELGVHAILEGSIRRDGDKLRVSAQFTSTRSGFGIWSNDWNKDAADLLAVQAGIARGIVTYLKYDMHGTRRALVLPPSRTMEAWNHYLRAVRTAESQSGAPGGQAGEMFAAAVAADPSYGLGWAALAKWNCQQFEWGFEGRGALDRALEASRRAIAADSWLPEAHEAEARVRVLRDRDWRGAERAFRRALEIEPSHVDSLFGYGRLVLGPQGRFEEAIEQMRRALRVDETRFDAHGEIVSALIRSGRLAEAREELGNSRVKGSPMADILGGRISLAKGEPSESLPLFERAARRNRGRWSLGFHGYGFAVAGQASDALRVLGELEALPQSAVEQAMIHTKLANRAKALDLIEQAEKEGLIGLLWAKTDERLADLRGEPRFGDVLRRMGL